MFREAAPRTPDKMPHPRPAEEQHEEPVWNPAAPTWEERDQHAKEITKREARIKEIQAIAASPLKKLGAMITGRPKNGELERLYEEVRLLRQDKRFELDNSYKGNGPTVH